MRKAVVPFTPEGVPMLFLAAFSSLIFAILGWWGVAVVFWLFTLFTLHFFRDPERVTPAAPNLAVSPADGKILSIEEQPDPFSKQKLIRIAIFMNVFNVHVNRSPVTSIVEEINYIPGAFINASFDKASEKNERCQWLLKDASGNSWTMVQIAGLIARRIVCRAIQGDKLARGERLGMIRFGSRVDVYLPPDFKPCVNIGDKVYAGETVIAKKSN